MSASGTPRSDPDGLFARGSGMNLVEASAGTGKTRRLTGIVAGIVVQGSLRLDEVLVVTFTRAATAELRDRIRETLRSAGRAVTTGEAEEGSQAFELLADWLEDPAFDSAAAARRLDTALQDIDRANVFTIHGFCQRVLSDLAFDGGFPFEFEMSGDDPGLVEGAAHDFWRRRMYPASKTLTGYAVERGFRPADLAAWVRQWRAKPDLRIEGGKPLAAPVESLETAWQGGLEEARVSWERHRDAFLEEVLRGSWLNRGRYRAPRTGNELAAIDALFAAPEPLLPPPGLVGRYGAEALEAACKKGRELPDIPVFEALDRLEEAAGELREGLEAWLRSARREILVEARESIRRRVREDRRLAYDDLLLELHDRLRGESGKRLSERIRRAYPCALIDEFQDTDPVQADVFMRIYGTRGDAPRKGGVDAPGAVVCDASRGAAPARTAFDRDVPGGRRPDEGNERRPASERGHDHPGPGGLLVVGDPKQSIYRFRGADVYAYLRASDAADTHHSLDRNWRSSPALVGAVNAVFARPDPFVVPEIAYPPVAPGREHGAPARFASADGEGPLRFRLLPERPDGKPWPKRGASRFAADAAAEAIARILLRAGDEKSGDDGDPPCAGREGGLTGADIAVLVRTRAQGRLVADALGERGVASVEVGDESVFDSREAEQMERLLWGLVEPGREARVRGALAGDPFGLDSPRLLELEENEEAWNEWSGRVREWRSAWHSGGIGSLLRRLVESEGGAARLLRYRDGARRLTNVRHLTELLQSAESEQRMAPAALAVWFSRRRAEARSRDEDTELRIESDEQLVRILTVHGAKGLEFPIVFLPFAWDARDPSRVRTDHAAYHGSASEGYPEVLDLEPDETARAAARREELSEEIRLLYVGLTRAKYRCEVTWGRVNGASRAPLAWLLHRGETGPASASSPAGDPGPGAGTTDGISPGAGLDAAEARFLGLDASKLHEEVEAFAAPRVDQVSVRVLTLDESARPTVLPAPPPIPLAARRLDRPLPHTRRLTSFSALTATDDPTAAPIAPTDVDGPDHDQHETSRIEDDGALPGETDEGRTAFTFPRGPTAGSCLHRMFEELDRSDEPRADLDGICREALSAFGFAAQWRDVARSLVERVRAVRLTERAPSPADGPEGANGFRLADPIPRLVELEFAFPVAGLDRDRLAAVLRDGGYPDPFPSSSGRRPDVPSPSPIDGYLRGFIDAVVVHAGRWYIVDYKSNWLGPAPEDYSSAAVSASMGASVYSLQYLLYIVALHRYLGLRVPNYDYERHIGGTFYLFVRGMDPVAGMDRGVWFDRPAASLVHRLDRLFRGDET
ncbi:MAG: UvrD-helicase domain-containing protein [Immundisolibacterales bacterium]|nr:UvrD-helicase domain-containing protein [Immundisolibacterales bacterium]